MSNSSSRELYEKAVRFIPGGVSRNTVYRRPHPHYVATAAGCWVTDVEGTSRLDFANNMASLIHGHAHPAIVDAVIEQLKRGTAYTMATEPELALAEHLCERVPSFERIRFTNSGTEAVMAMIKAARAHTGRPAIAKAEGAYHGTYDYAEVSQTAAPATWGDVNEPTPVPLVRGTPQGVLDDVIIFPFNDLPRTLAILDRHASRIACVLIDPVPHRVGLMPATVQYLEGLHAWTRRNDALLVFDEVVTLRVAHGGAQEGYPVHPDLTAVGKMIGGGFPVGGLAGRADILSLLDPSQDSIPFPHSGTFSANPITMTAGLVAMEQFDEAAVRDLNALADRAVIGICEAARTVGVPITVTGAGSMFRLHVSTFPPVTYREAYQPPAVKSVFNALLDYLFTEENMILLNTCGCMLSTVMTTAEIDRLVEAMERGFRHLKPELDALRPEVGVDA